MGVMTNYIRWRGDLSFRERPVTVPDGMVLSALGYFGIKDDFVPGTKPFLSDILEKQIREDRILSTSLDPKDVAEEFIEAVAKSRRFGKAKILDCMDVYDAEDGVQFAAVTLRLDDRSTVVSFRGTDDSLAGWKEDFMISFTRPKAQQMALDYLIDALRKYRNVYVCGHSKGANLALYASAFLDDKHLSRVRAVFVNDGPGFCEEVLPADRLKKIDGLATMIVPSDGLVGRIFEPELSDKRIVRSVNSGLMAHSIYSWVIEDNDLVCEGKYSRTSNIIAGSLDKWLRGADLAKREALVDQIFGVLKESGYERLSDFKENGFSELIGVFAKKLGTSISSIQPKELIMNQVENIRSKLTKS